MKKDPENDHKTEKDELTGEKILEGHEYDGIRELDNKLPKWWLGLFYITIIFAVVYFLRFHVLHTGPLQAEEYAMEMEKAADKYEATTAEAEPFEITLLTDDASLQAGKVIYDKNCAVCHLAQGEGLVGPNLTDKYWIHGGSLEDIYDIIVVGNPSKGMISWKDQLTPEEILQVSSYVYMMEGTNPPNQKAPEGELFERES